MVILAYAILKKKINLVLIYKKYDFNKIFENIY